MNNRPIAQDDIIHVRYNAQIAEFGRYWIVVKAVQGQVIEVASIATGQRESIEIAEVLEVFRATWKMPSTHHPY